MRIFSYGGGVQSNAVLVLAAQGKVQYDYFVFSNVGDDSENPDTLDYVRNIAMPYAEAHGIELVTVQKTRRDGSVETLRQKIMSNLRDIKVPAWFINGSHGNRTCTIEFKIRVVAKFAKQYGASHIMGIGISLDEFQRARTDSGIKGQTLEYPLLDLRLSRKDCRAIIEGAGLPIPPKSACYFCPFQAKRQWIALLHDKPDLFAKAVEIDHYIREKLSELGRDEMYLHVSRHPLDQAVGLQYTFDDIQEGEICDFGYCFL